MDPSAKSHTLRPYQHRRDEMTFFATTPSTANTSTRGGAAPDGMSLQLPSKPANRYMSAEGDAALRLEYERATPGAFIKGLLVSGALQYTSTCLAMPFEIGKLLLQVQWVPREEVWRQMHAPMRPLVQKSPAEDEEETDSVDPWAESAHDAWGEEDEDEDDEPDKYFRDLSAPSGDYIAEAPRMRRTDSSGYVMPRGRHDSATRPEFMMPVVVKGGVWEMIKAVARGKEGYFGLWKGEFSSAPTDAGTFTTFLLDLSTSALQSIVSGILSIFAPKAMNPMPIAFSPYPFTTLTLLMTSHIVTGVAVSPLDLVRTRLIAQSTLPQYRKYAGPLDALSTILREEGGWRTTYLSPSLFVPTLFDYLFRSLFALGAPLLIENVLHLDPSAVPVSYALAELVLSTLSLGITLPIETVRRRMQLNYHEPLRRSGTAGLLAVKNANTARLGLRTCVETRPVPYKGFCECVYRIISEETTTVPRKGDVDDDTHTIASAGNSSLGGIRNLYRGFGMAFSANILVFVLTLVTGEREGRSGWTEI